MPQKEQFQRLVVIRCCDRGVGVSFPKPPGKENATMDCQSVTLNTVEFVVWMSVPWVNFRVLLLVGGQWPPLLESEP